MIPIPVEIGPTPWWGLVIWLALLVFLIGINVWMFFRK